MKVKTKLFGEDVVIHILQAKEEISALSLKLLKEKTLILGFDLEWRSTYWNLKHSKSKSDVRGKAAILQLAYKRDIYIIRINRNNFNEDLKNLLESETIIKGGVGVKQDSKILFTDYGILPKGLIELNYLLGRPKNAISLNNCVKKYVGISLKKNKEITLSDWENWPLTPAQIEYAATDALASRLALIGILNRATSKNIIISDLLEDDGFDDSIEAYKFSFVPKFNDDEKKKKNDEENNNIDNSEKVKENKRLKRKRLESIARKKNLYDNYELKAPDGVTISMIPEKKKKWYISKGLAVVISEGAIQLKFEPKGRTNVNDKFYLEHKSNQCVSCRATTFLNKFYIIPHEFRRHFPHKYRARSSHDIVLLCQTCRKTTETFYRSRRSLLLHKAFTINGLKCNEAEYNKLKYKIDDKIYQVKQLIFPLLKKNIKLPEKRKIQIYAELSKMLNLSEDKLDTEYLIATSKLQHKTLNESFVPTGKLVVDAVLLGHLQEKRPASCQNETVGSHESKPIALCDCLLCIESEQMLEESLVLNTEYFSLKCFIRCWRIFFTNCFDKPLHMPKGWSVTHKIQDYQEDELKPGKLANENSSNNSEL